MHDAHRGFFFSRWALARLFPIASGGPLQQSHLACQARPMRCCGLDGLPGPCPVSEPCASTSIPIPAPWVPFSPRSRSPPLSEATQLSRLAHPGTLHSCFQGLGLGFGLGFGLVVRSSSPRHLVPIPDHPREPPKPPQAIPGHSIPSQTISTLVLLVPLSSLIIPACPLWSHPTWQPAVACGHLFRSFAELQGSRLVRSNPWPRP